MRSFVAACIAAGLAFSAAGFAAENLIKNGNVEAKTTASDIAGSNYCHVHSPNARRPYHTEPLRPPSGAAPTSTPSQSRRLRPGWQLLSTSAGARWNEHTLYRPNIRPSLATISFVGATQADATSFIGNAMLTAPPRTAHAAR